MPAAKGPQPPSPIQFVAEKLTRSLIYYASLFICVVIAIGVSYSLILHLARESVQDQAPGPLAIAEARSLQDYCQELRDITAMLEKIRKEDDAPPSNAFSRRLNDLRRRMRQYPHDSDALNALIQTGDGLIAWAAAPGEKGSRDRVRDALTQAESAVKLRIETLNVSDSLLP